MGGSEDEGSGTTGSPPSSRSSKSSNKSSSRRRLNKSDGDFARRDSSDTTGDSSSRKLKKKKSKTRRSSQSQSDNEASLTDINGGKSGSSSSRRKSSSGNKQKKKSSRELINDNSNHSNGGKDMSNRSGASTPSSNDNGPTINTTTLETRSAMYKKASKRTSFNPDSTTTIEAPSSQAVGVRHNSSENDLLTAMGKSIPPPPSSTQHVVVKPALKPSKYGSASSAIAGGGNGAGSKKKLSFGKEDSDDSSDDDSLPKPMFQIKGTPVVDDDDKFEVELNNSKVAPPPSTGSGNGRGMPKRRFSLSASNLTKADNKPQDDKDGKGGGGGNTSRSRRLSRSLEQQGDDQQQEQSFNPQRVRPRLGSRQSSKTSNRLGDELLKSSITRPGIQRRRSVGSSRASLDEDGNPLLMNDESLYAKRSLVHMNQHKHIRRLKMSVENQTFIPPKSKHSSIFNKAAHKMSMQIVNLTLWTYQASFLPVMLFFLAFYIVNIFIWAAVLDAVDVASGGQCIFDDADQMLTRRDRYEYVFELSWATFTTVGYGTVSPSGEATGCYAIRFTCAFVAFIGILFASQTAAIMYSKLMRMLAKAHVTFSSTLCVQYGKGNEGSTVRHGQLNFRASVATPAMLGGKSIEDLMNEDDDDDEDDEQEVSEGSDDGFPVIEFRMINDRANHEGSEIWDAQISAIVQLNKEQNINSPSSASRITNSYTLKDKAMGGESLQHNLDKKVFYPLTLSPDSHPHFSRIWYARHTLNAESPLLKREIRDMIVNNGGKWDKDLNCWEEIRECLNEFCSLRVTIKGTSAVSASDVYGEYVYEFEDVCVGWRFANMVYEKPPKSCMCFGSGKDTRTKIDTALLHDIVPQPGGDHEPLHETSGAGIKSWFSSSRGIQ